MTALRSRTFDLLLGGWTALFGAIIPPCSGPMAPGCAMSRGSGSPASWACCAAWSGSTMWRSAPPTARPALPHRLQSPVDLGDDRLHPPVPRCRHRRQGGAAEDPGLRLVPAPLADDHHRPGLRDPGAAPHGGGRQGRPRRGSPVLVFPEGTRKDPDTPSTSRGASSCSMAGSTCPSCRSWSIPVASGASAGRPSAPAPSPSPACRRAAARPQVRRDDGAGRAGDGS